LKIAQAKTFEQQRSWALIVPQLAQLEHKVGFADFCAVTGATEVQ